MGKQISINLGSSLGSQNQLQRYKVRKKLLLLLAMGFSFDGGCCNSSGRTMSSSLLRVLLLALLFMSTIPQKSDGEEFEEWCIADEQTPEEELQKALDWACGNGGDCSKMQVNQPCYFPNTLKEHASFAFNSYYQKLKHKGATCYFNAAAIITALDPSHGSCKYVFLP